MALKIGKEGSEMCVYVCGGGVGPGGGGGGGGGGEGARVVQRLAGWLSQILRREFAQNFNSKSSPKVSACADFRRKFVTTNRQTSVVRLRVAPSRNSLLPHPHSWVAPRAYRLYEKRTCNFHSDCTAGKILIVANKCVGVAK